MRSTAKHQIPDRWVLYCGKGHKKPKEDIISVLAKIKSFIARSWERGGHGIPPLHWVQLLGTSGTCWPLIGVSLCTEHLFARRSAKVVCPAEVRLIGLCHSKTSLSTSEITFLHLFSDPLPTAKFIYHQMV